MGVNYAPKAPGYKIYISFNNPVFIPMIIASERDETPNL